jgi:serine/threonine protein kinase
MPEPILLSLKALIAIVKLCVDIKVGSSVLSEEAKRIQNRLRYLIPEIPRWESTIDGNTDHQYILNNLYEDVKRIRQILEKSSWSSILSRNFTPGEVKKQLRDAESCLDKALADVRHVVSMETNKAIVQQALEINNANIQELIQQAIEYCYNDKNENNHSATALITSTVAHGEDRYIIERHDFVYAEATRIGKGGFAEVFKGTYTCTGRSEEVAIKVIDSHKNYPCKADLPEDEFKSQCDRVRDETILMRHASIHPNIVDVYGCYIPEDKCDKPIIVMELMKTSLASILEDNNNLPPFCCRLQLMEGIASAVEFLHLQGIVHQDIKPSNILVDADKTIAKLADFGLARNKEFDTVWDCVRTAYITSLDHHDGKIDAGTYAYMSPEKLLGKVTKASRSADVYSLGVTLWQCISCQTPPVPKTKDELLAIDKNGGENMISFPLVKMLQVHNCNLLPRSYDEKRYCSIIEQTAYSCLLWDHTKRPNATNVSRMLSGDIPSEMMDVLSVSISRWDDTEFDSQLHELDDLHFKNSPIEGCQFDNTEKVYASGEFDPSTKVTTENTTDFSNNQDNVFQERSLSSVGSISFVPVNEERGQITWMFPGRKTIKTEGSLNEKEGFSPPTDIVVIPDPKDNADNKLLNTNVTNATSQSTNVSTLSTLITKLQSQRKSFWIVAIAVLAILVIVAVLLSNRKSNQDVGADRSSVSAPISVPSPAPLSSVSNTSERNTEAPSQQRTRRPIVPILSFPNVTNSSIGPTYQPNQTSSQSPNTLQVTPSPVLSPGLSVPTVPLPSLFQVSLSPQIGNSSQMNTGGPSTLSTHKVLPSILVSSSPQSGPSPLVAIPMSQAGPVASQVVPVPLPQPVEVVVPTQALAPTYPPQLPFQQPVIVPISTEQGPGMLI